MREVRRRNGVVVVETPTRKGFAERADGAKAATLRGGIATREKEGIAKGSEKGEEGMREEAGDKGRRIGKNVLGVGESGRMSGRVNGWERRDLGRRG